MIRTAAARFAPATVALGVLAVLLTWSSSEALQSAPADPVCLTTGMDILFTGAATASSTQADLAPAAGDPAYLTTGMDLILTCSPEATPTSVALESGYLSTGMDLWLGPRGLVSDL